MRKNSPENYSGFNVLRDVSDIVDTAGDDERFFASSTPFKTTDSSHKSLGSSAIINATTSNSKAVLAALRALQDKIRRLESEKNQALDEISQLRRQLSNVDIEAENARQKDKLIAQKNLSEAQILREKLLSEKNDLENKLTTMEQKARESKETLDELMQQIRKLELDRNLAENRLKELESQVERVMKELKHSQQRERGIRLSINFLVLYI